MSERRDTSAPGQALEFEIWSDLIKQSQGALHVFLPLLDRGLDAVLHRLTDGKYIPVQIKGRTTLNEGRVEILVQAESLVDDDALLIATLVFDVPDQLVLVVTERDFKRLAAHDHSAGHEVYVAAFRMHPGQSHWLPYLVPRAQLAERVLGPSVTEAVDRLSPDLLKPFERHNEWLGFLGESEVIRRLAESPRLDLFRPFPDLEMVEVLARGNVTHNFAGLQVKAATVSPPHGEAEIHIRTATLTSDPTTWVVGLAWRKEANAFDGECLLIPAADIPKVAIDNGPAMTINFRPSSPRRTPLDPYRKPLAELSQLILEAVSEAGGRPTESRPS
jgi:hypothetical protein